MSLWRAWRTRPSLLRSRRVSPWRRSKSKSKTWGILTHQEFDFCRQTAEGAKLSQTIISRKNPPCPWLGGIIKPFLCQLFPEVRLWENNLRKRCAHTLSPATGSKARPTTCAPRRPVKYSLFTGSSLPHKAAPYLGPVDLEPQWNWEEITAVKMDKELKEEM